MKIFLTLDYELYLMNPGNNVDYSLIEPTNHLLDILKRQDILAVFFVDAAYLSALERYKDEHSKLESDYAKIVSQLMHIESLGHELGLHIHPHWEDCIYDGKKWIMNLSRYKLSDFSAKEAASLFAKYYDTLQLISNKKIISYRAGGWCIEPFKYIRDTMRSKAVFIDTSVLPGAHFTNKTHHYDFRKYPNKDYWRFTDDPSEEDNNGYFIELPCTAYRLPQSHYWKKSFERILNRKKMNSSGAPIRQSFTDVLRKLFLPNIIAVSIDEYKSNTLLSCFKEKELSNDNYFSIIGHPKCFNKLTYDNLEAFGFYAKAKGHSFVTFTACFKNITAHT
jgi:hypothetical protein